MQDCLHKIGARLLGKLTIYIDNAGPLQDTALYCSNAYIQFKKNKKSRVGNKRQGFSTKSEIIWVFYLRTVLFQEPFFNFL